MVQNSRQDTGLAENSGEPESKVCPAVSYWRCHGAICSIWSSTIAPPPPCSSQSSQWPCHLPETKPEPKLLLPLEQLWIALSKSRLLAGAPLAPHPHDAAPGNGTLFSRQHLSFLPHRHTMGKALLLPFRACFCCLFA